MTGWGTSMNGTQVEFRSNGRAVITLERPDCNLNGTVASSWLSALPVPVLRSLRLCPIRSRRAGARRRAQNMFADSKTPQFDGYLSVCRGSLKPTPTNCQRGGVIGIRSGHMCMRLLMTDSERCSREVVSGLGSEIGCWLGHAFTEWMSRSASERSAEDSNR